MAALPALGTPEAGPDLSAMLPAYRPGLNIVPFHFDPAGPDVSLLYRTAVAHAQHRPTILRFFNHTPPQDLIDHLLNQCPPERLLCWTPGEVFPRELADRAYIPDVTVVDDYAAIGEPFSIAGMEAAHNAYCGLNRMMICGVQLTDAGAKKAISHPGGRADLQL